MVSAASEQHKYSVTEEDLAKLVVNRQASWYIITFLIYFLCAGFGFVLAIFVVRMLANIMR